MAEPALMITSAGRGETPLCPDARFKRGDVVKVRNLKAIRHFPRQAVVLVAVPPGFPAEYALADALAEDRPLMIGPERPYIRYILVNEGDPKPYIARETHLIGTGETVEIGEVRREGSDDGNA